MRVTQLGTAAPLRTVLPAACPLTRETPESNTEPDRAQLLARGGQAAVGATLTGAVGAGLGMTTALLGVPPAVGGTVGGVIGAALGGWYGWHWPSLVYDAEAKGREFRNRITAEVNGAIHRVDKRILNFRAADRTPPLGDKDLRGIRATGRTPRMYDGFDSSRDIFALYAREGSGERYAVQVEMAHLRPAAEYGNLDTYVLVDWGAASTGTPALPFSLDGVATRPYKVAVKVHHNYSSALEDAAGNPLGKPVNVQHNTTFNRVCFEIDKAVLRDMGWKDGEPLRFEAMTTSDPSNGVSTRLCSEDSPDPNVFRWEGKLVYYAVTDRFYNGDRANDHGVDLSNPEGYHGGDWQGLIDKLDYLESMKVDCLWISCPYENQRGFFGKDGFHGYWPMSFRDAEPNFGDKARLRELCDKAHAKGIKVMLDVVINHTGYDHEWVRDPQYREWFHQYGKIKGLGQWQMENGSLAGLPDLVQDNPVVEKELLESHQEWMRETGLDAMRIDAVRHVPEWFLRKFDQQMRVERPDFFSVGEAFWQDPNFVAGYQNRTMDSMFDFPLAYKIRYVFSGDDKETRGERLVRAQEAGKMNDQERLRLMWHSGQESMTRLSGTFKADKYYDNPKKLGTLIDNHDMIRFMSDCGGDLRKLEIATAFLFAARGTPHVYYGTEVGMTGMGAENRADMKWGQNPQLVDRFRALSAARHSSPALMWGHQEELHASRWSYALTRMRPDEEVVCVFNNADSPARVEFSMHEESQVPEGAVLKDMLSSLSATVADGRVGVDLPAKGYAFLRWREP